MCKKERVCFRSSLGVLEWWMSHTDWPTHFLRKDSKFGELGDVLKGGGSWE